MIELRWVERVVSHDKAGARYCNRDKCWMERVLQYRFVDDDGSPVGHLNWTEWRDVPTVKEP